MKFLWVSLNISEPIGKMIFPQLSLLQLWRHITFICISKWLPPYQKFLHFECKYLENQRWYWKTINGILSYLIRSYIWDRHVFWVNIPFKDCRSTLRWVCEWGQNSWDLVTQISHALRISVHLVVKWCPLGWKFQLRKKISCVWKDYNYFLTFL